MHNKRNEIFLEPYKEKLVITIFHLKHTRIMKYRLVVLQMILEIQRSNVSLQHCTLNTFDEKENSEKLQSQGFV